MKNNILGFIGILFKANKALIGEEARLSQKGKLAFLAFDASERSKKEIYNLAAKNDISIIEDYSKVELGNALGYDEVTYLLIVDKKASLAIIEKRKE